MKTLMTETMSMMTMMTTVLQRGSEDCLVMLSHFQLYNFAVYSGRSSVSHGVAASSLKGLYDLVSVSVVSSVLQKKRRNSCFHLLCLSNSSMSDCVYPCPCMRL